MKTKIRTIHEEDYSDGSRTIGILFNYSLDDNDWKESYLYVYKEGMYIFFNTIIETIDYLLFGEKKMKRAYMKEDEFDVYYFTDYIEGTFGETLKWIV
jgi:hypothetical protein